MGGPNGQPRYRNGPSLGAPTHRTHLLTTDISPAQPPSPAVAALLDAGIAHIAAEGFGTLTLRPLAERAGVSVGTISHHLGAKEHLLTLIVERARGLDQEFFDPWLKRAAILGDHPHPLRGDLIEEAFSAWIRRASERAFLFCELVSAKASPPEIQRAFAAWVDLHREIWTELAGDRDAGLLLAAYLADETAFSLGLDDVDAYACLRRLGIRRLIEGPEAETGARQTSMDLFRHLQAELAPPRSLVDLPADQQPTKKEAIAIAAGMVIVDHGVEAVTHRSVASLAKAPPSTVVYHYGARESLVEAGLEAIIRGFQNWLRQRNAQLALGGDASSQATQDLVRATYAVAIGAVRYPSLRPHAADMRRRRGENIKDDTFAEVSGLPREAFDAYSAQVLSVVIFGARMLAMSLGEDQTDRLFGVMHAFARWWEQRTDR